MDNLWISGEGVWMSPEMCVGNEALCAFFRIRVYDRSLPGASEVGKRCVFASSVRAEVHDAR